MKYAVIKIGGSQYKVAESDEIKIEKIEGKKSDSVDFKDVLLLVDEKKIKIGEPFLPKVKVKAKILDQIKGPKIRVATYKAKSRYRKVKGQRKQLTRVKILSILK